MNRKCIMLVDDNHHDNFFNKRTIRDLHADDIVIAIESPVEALAYLKSMKEPRPDLILLDIYMPVMSGWEFLDEYCKMDKAAQDGTIVVMLATAGDPAHIEKAKKSDIISDYIVKPLTGEKMHEIADKYLRGEKLPL